MGKYFTCFIPTVALGYGSWHFGDLEKEGKGAQWDNINPEEWGDGTVINIMECMIFLYADGVLYMIIAWYIDNVFPGDLGKCSSHLSRFRVDKTKLFHFLNSCTTL